MYKTVQIRINKSNPFVDFFVNQCKESNDLINCALYVIRQEFFETCKHVGFWDKSGSYRSGVKTARVRASYRELDTQFKSTRHYKALGGQCAQQTLKSVVESVTSYNGLLKLWFKGELKKKPKMPNYRTKGGLAVIAYPAQALKFDWATGQCRIPLSRELKDYAQEHLQSKEVWLPGPVGIKPEQVVELRILPRNRELYVEYAYMSGNDGPTCNLALDRLQALGIDPGLSNWLTCVSTAGSSFIVDGRWIKSVNQLYNKRVAQLKQGKPQGFWSDELAALAEKRNRQMRDAINKAARLVVNRCLQDKIGIVVFGWNKGNKDSIGIGKVNNQSFVQIPTARLKNRIEQLCHEAGIQFIETEESYTSKASFIDGDVIPVYGSEKPANWKPSGKRGQRVKGKALNLGRGGYKTADGTRVNSDCNGAANILRKVATQLGISLAKVGKGSLTLPKRYKLDSLSKSYRDRCETTCLQAVV